MKNKTDQRHFLPNKMQRSSSDNVPATIAGDVNDPPIDMMADNARAMRLTATIMLIVMAALFLLSHRFLEIHPAWGYLHAFAEAAMIGGIADWFAVTALFRHPMGVPIPHTAIIPRNKDRIADTMAQFLRTNFLIPAVVARRMHAMNMAKAVGGFLVQPSQGSQSRIGTGAAELVAGVLESLDPDRLGGQVKAGLKAQAHKVDIAPLLGQMLSTAIADKRHLPLIDSIIRWSGLTLEDNEDMVRAMIRERANSVLRWTGLDGRLSDSVLDGLYKLLAEVLIDPEHPLRNKVQEGLDKLAHDLMYDPQMQARVARMKAEVLENDAVARWWEGVWERMRAGMIRMARDPETALGGQIGESLAELGAALHDDGRLQMQVNRFARRTAVGVATRYGDQIVQLVSETVRRWDAQTLTDRVESAVGRDLQFIRINGTLVGGLIGVTIHFIVSLI